MLIPRRIRLLRPAAVLVGLYAAIWMALEGSMVRDVALAAAVLALVLLAGVARLFGGRLFSRGRAAALGAGSGLVFGAGLVAATLFLMALKTGIHAHGPEYTMAEVAWVWRQLPLWVAAGTLAGTGLALVAAGRARL